MTGNKIFFAVFSLFFPVPAHAFHVDEHVAITRRAILGLEKCGLLPHAWNNSWTDLIGKANEDEDLDVFRKWSKYSHYYNPNHPIDQPRADSSLSVRESVAAILQNPRDDVASNQLIGRIVHHVQDASVPAHAIPVMHAASDGFELLDISSYYAEPFSPEDCTGLAAANPMDLLHSNALATLSALQIPVVYKSNGVFRKAPWQGSFWALGAGNAFGSYGTLGDHFGQTAFAADSDHTVTLDPAQFRAFKRARVQAAVRATQGVILWANKTRGF
ncbi:MAG: hypothetical protein ACXWSC_01650 [Bdellovibrionota bacterium]